MRAVFRALAVLVLLSTAFSSTGCATYLPSRGDDLKDVFDVGLTTSSEPRFSFYIGFLNLLTVGYANVDGTIHGMAGSQTGSLAMRQHAYGLLLWGKERFGYDESFNQSDPESPEAWRVGVLGLVLGPRPQDGQIVNCPKMFHFGWIGVTLNCKFGQLADFLLGWATFDIMGDDEKPRPVAGAEA